MEEPQSQKTVTPATDVAEIPCGECERSTRHRVLAETQLHWQDATGMVDVWKEYQIVQCQGCLTVSFCECSSCSEDFTYDKEGRPELVPTRKFFPNRAKGRPSMQDSHYVPTRVLTVYEEAHAALCAELPIMAGFGIRGIVEAVCKDKRIDGKNLEQRIDQLAGSGHITNSQCQFLHRLRFMGNAAAHEMKAHSQKEINAAFDVVEHLLKGVYILPKLAARLPKSRDKRAKRKSTDESPQ